MTFYDLNFVFSFWNPHLLPEGSSKHPLIRFLHKTPGFSVFQPIETGCCRQNRVVDVGLLAINYCFLVYIFGHKNVNHKTNYCKCHLAVFTQISKHGSA
jgi:hypothetical protein